MLGLVWRPKSDEFVLKIRAERDIAILTKLAVEGEIARLYNPNGVLAPVTIVVTIFIQDMRRGNCMGRANYKGSLRSW